MTRTAAEASITTVCISAACTDGWRNVRLCSHQNKRRRAFQRFGIALVTIGVLEEDSVAAAYGQLAIALRIPREANARRGIEEMSL